MVSGPNPYGIQSASITVFRADDNSTELSNLEIKFDTAANAMRFGSDLNIKVPPMELVQHVNGSNYSSHFPKIISINLGDLGSTDEELIQKLELIIDYLTSNFGYDFKATTVINEQNSSTYTPSYNSGSIAASYPTAPMVLPELNDDHSDAEPTKKKCIIS